jgi:hypothetical protein
MKLQNTLLAGAAVLASLVNTSAAPLLQVTVRSYGDLTNAIATFAASIHPNSKTDDAKQFFGMLGFAEQGGFDVKRPWQIAVWLEEPNEPLLAIKAPADNVSLFKDSLKVDGMIRAKDPTFSQLENGLSLIAFTGNEALSEPRKAALDQWKNMPIGQPSKAVEIAFSLSENLRQQAVGLMGFAKMSATQAMSSQASAATGINPKAMGDVINAYCDVIDIVLAGFAEAKIGLDLTADTLLIDKVVTAKPDTELAKWFQKSTNPLLAQDYTGIDPDAFASVAMGMGKDAGLLKFAEKMTLIGFSMQNTNVDETMASGLREMFDKMLPMNFSGSMYMREKFAFSGIYRFPSSSAAEAYAQIKTFLNKTISSMAGADKIYSQMAMVEKHHTVNGIAVDRFTATINTNSPLFKMPGQQEQLKTFWPDGKMEFDYAVKDNQILAAMPDRMQELMERSERKSDRESAFNGSSYTRA